MIELQAEMTLKTAWRQRLELRAEGKKLRTEADKLWAEGDQRSAEAKKLWTEADERWAEANERWFAAIREARGNIDFAWHRRGDILDCVLATGEVFRGDEPSDRG